MKEEIIQIRRTVKQGLLSFHHMEEDFCYHLKIKKPFSQITQTMHQKVMSGITLSIFCFSTSFYLCFIGMMTLDETDFESYIKSVLREEMTNTLGVLDQFMSEYSNGINRLKTINLNDESDLFPVDLVYEKGRFPSRNNRLRLPNK